MKRFFYSEQKGALNQPFAKPHPEISPENRGPATGTFGTQINIWTPPALQAASSLLESGSDCNQYIRPLMRPSTRAQMTICSREPHKFYRV